ncbi:MAG: glycosyltransferase, partial [Candidatus Omnitrophica bacterium]|nr:glycosyltransferase [Candidatus Omnitrophota bacterium]
MKKVLVIPHQPYLEKLRIRLIEIAKALREHYKIYLFHWNVSENLIFRERLFCALKDILKIKKIYLREGIEIIEFPLLHRPYNLAVKFNSFWLNKFVDEEGLDTVINGSYYMFSIPPSRNFKYIYDLADLPVTAEKISFNKFVQDRVIQEIKKADVVTVASSGLADYVKNNYCCNNPIFIPNGADIERLRSVDPLKVEQIRQKYNLLGKWVIGYIGNMGEWVDIEITVEAFKKLKAKIPQSILLWVGAYTRVRNLVKKYSADDVIFTGGINAKEEIGLYFQLIDVGIIPHKPSLFQNLTFQIKLIEYTAARKIVISSPLAEAKILGFP